MNYLLAEKYGDREEKMMKEDHEAGQDTLK